MDTFEIHRIKDGRIYETGHIEDFFGAYQQMVAATDKKSLGRCRDSGRKNLAVP